MRSVLLMRTFMARLYGWITQRSAKARRINATNQCGFCISMAIVLTSMLALAVTAVTLGAV
ncbi:MAG: hypothetical protein M1434_06575 [Chloroflexi bacterium]|nr:hypothetical protein [Chloroflexota bacterium]MCL5274396.1 hypothetical protein [Chloroflexota bacterium]